MGEIPSLLCLGGFKKGLNGTRKINAFSKADEGLAACAVCGWMVGCLVGWPTLNKHERIV